MPTAFLRCDKCQTILHGAMVNATGPIPCPTCQSPILTRVFPAFFRPEPTGQQAETVGSDEEASCFFHPRKKAVASCANCGRFLCSLCDLELGGRHLCPGCLESGAGQSKKGLGELENQRFLHDHLALMLAGIPLIPPLLALWPFLFFTGPTALYLVVRYWGEPPRGFIPRTRTRLVFAAIFALLQLAFVANVVYFGWYTAHMARSLR